MSDETRLIDPTNLAFVEELYADFVRDPDSVPQTWREYFRRMDGHRGPVRLRPSFKPASIFRGRIVAADLQHDLRVESLQDRVDQLVREYRVRGHMIAQLDPLGRKRPVPPELTIEYYGFTAEDLERPFSSRSIKGPPYRTLGDILRRLQNTYCRYIGVQYMHIDDAQVREWLQERMESTENRIQLTRRQQYRILTRLTDAVIFEDFIQKKFIGAKSFSLEGAESLIPLLDLTIEFAAELGVEEIVLGMAHRGRLNVLANIMGKSPRQIFREFEDLDAEANLGRGDVKYHLGYHSDWTTTTGREVHLALCFNPSHLEYVNPVALGRMRAKQDRIRDAERKRGMTILIHGDAAFAGEGIVQETLNLSELEAYRIGGCIHVIVNNQIGFTTPPEESRSSLYCSAIGKMLQIPIFHVNGEDPESVAQVMHLATEFRQTFGRDVIVDMYCYRRRGHNESDEPEFTQPLLYKQIKRKPSVRDSYRDKLVEMGQISREEADAIAEALRERLEQELSAVHEPPVQPPPRKGGLGEIWQRYRGGPDGSVPEVETGVPKARLIELLEKLCELPEGFHPHRKIVRFLENRRKMAREEKPLDWATAEALAFATLAVEGTRVRVTGQDTARGTFSQRHATLFDVETGEPYTPLEHLAPDQAPVEIRNSPLSESGVLGFEYGYSIAYPDALVAWEAQFGDFANVAAPIIDQFIASAEDKWNSLSGLVLLLPHGFEGQGPEHSSARVERFLQLCAEDNMQVVNPTTPAQYFHVLRRQVLRPWRKPLVVLTPKSLLRHPRCVSRLDDLAGGYFRRVLPDDQPPHDGVRRILLCSGKIWYELSERRQQLGIDDVALIRVEQYFPLARKLLEEALSPYPEQAEVVWVQEEPRNMGAWSYLRTRFGETLAGRPLRCVSRPASASPATGSPGSHKLEQERLLQQAYE